MKKIVFLMILFGFFIDYAFLPAIVPNFAGANLLLIVVAIACFERNFPEAIGWSVLAGLMLDYVSHTPFGTNVFLFILSVWMFDFLRRKLLPAKIRTGIALLLFSGSLAFYEIVKVIFLKFLGILGIYGFAEGSGVLLSEPFFMFLATKILVVLAGVLIFKMYHLAKGIWGVDKLEIKI